MPINYKIEKGDGLSFHKAVLQDGRKAPVIFEAMNIKNATFYRLYRKEQFDPEEKEAAAKALGKSIADIFGIQQTPGDEMRSQKAIGETQRRKIPVVGEALAGTEMEMDTAPVYTGEYIDVGDLLRDSDAAFTVYGNSMNPNYPSGSVLGLKRNYDGFIQPGEIYVIQTKSNRVFKRLWNNEDKTGYICYSDNTMIFESGPLKGKYFYEPFEILKDEELRLFDVTGMIKRTRNSLIVDRKGG